MSLPGLITMAVLTKRLDIGYKNLDPPFDARIVL
jgi:hypothetical protein